VFVVPPSGKTAPVAETLFVYQILFWMRMPFLLPGFVRAPKRPRDARIKPYVGAIAMVYTVGRPPRQGNGAGARERGWRL
jgi:hypothetical protein